MSKPCHHDKHGQLYVLSVDDDPVNLMVVEQLLAPEGWKVLSAQDGLDAYAALDEEDTWPDFIFLDFNLGTGDSGDQICMKMRQIFGNTAIPIVMCTAMSEGAAELQQCRAAGATDYLLKPYERNAMVSKVKQYCEAKVLPKRLAPAAPVVPAPSPPLKPPVEAPAAPPPQPATVPPPQAPSLGSSPEDVLSLCCKLDLEYCGRKLMDGNITLDQLRGMDDAALRKAGIVVKSQRDKIMSAVAVL